MIIPALKYASMTEHRAIKSWRPLASSALLYSMAGTIGAFLGWALLEPFFREGGSGGRIGLANAFLFPLVAGTMSASLAAVNKSVSQQFSKALTCAVGGFGVVFAGTFLVMAPSQILFNWITSTAHPGPAMTHTVGFVAALAGRAAAWGLIGMVIGLGTSYVVGKRGLALYGLMGGLTGGLMAGMLFDPIQILVSGADKSSWTSRMVGFTILGGMTGFLTGLMEDAKCGGLLLITSGPCAGTRLVLDGKPCFIGSSRGCDIVLPSVAEFAQLTAVVHKIGFRFELNDPRQSRGHIPVSPPRGTDHESPEGDDSS